MSRRVMDAVWIIVGEDGRSALLGRCAPPDDDVARAEAALVAAGEAGWLALCRGDRWGRRPVTLECARGLGAPKSSFADAARAFERVRRERLAALA
jgi:hypothetical protein